MSAGGRGDAVQRRRSGGAAAAGSWAAGGVLLVDIGNTRIKWAVLRRGRLGPQHAEPFAGWKAGDFARVFGVGSRDDASRRRGVGRASRGVGVGGAGDLRSAGGIGSATGVGSAGGAGSPGDHGGDGMGRIIVSSVAGSRVNRMFAEAARHAHGPKPEFVASQRRAGGVSTAYVEPWRLGVDRFVMAIGAHQLAKGRAACIVSIGTALTIDLVDARGRHRGGAILPAPPLMVDSLLTKTDGIRRRAAAAGSGAAASKSAGGSLLGDGTTAARRGSRSIFARTTREAIEQGALLAAAAAVDRGIDEARRAVGHSPVVLLTGGGAKSVAPLIQRPYWSVPDLVLQGLAVLANESRPPSRDS